ncbi:unnamed protein product, partial [Mesorhabditis belari]|uniref:glutathione transferase n=1 Tax=Mesorhabditis belari TaxID=2138241 RepID=A0AAF3E9K1_9BILA
MSSRYKLTYFYFRAKGENIRQILTLAGVEFEDVRVHWDKWQQIKNEQPFGQLPLKRLAGENEWEAAQIDALSDQFEDFFQEIRPFYKTYNKLIEGNLNDVYDKIVEPARDKHLPIFSKYLAESSSGFLVGSKLSWIDTQLADHMYTFTEFRPDYARRYPQIEAPFFKFFLLSNMVHYKLVYFPAKGLAETPRQLFALAGVDYEDVRIPKEEWPQHKPNAPFGTAPWLEVDGKKLAQSRAINRYLGKKFGYAGKDDFESAQIDAWGDQFSDYIVDIRTYLPVAAGMAEGDKEKLYKEVVEPAREKFFPLVVKRLSENEAGFLVGDKLSWADLFFANHLEYFVTGGFNSSDYLDKYPELLAYQKRIHNIPEIKKWIEKRPQTAL